MILLLLRHAEAEPLGESYPLDEDRPLTRNGKRQAAAIAGVLQRLELSPGLVLSSPRRRCVETIAEIRQRTSGIPAAHLVPELDLGGDWSHLVRRLETEIAKLAVKHEAVILACGHQPCLGRFATRALCGAATGTKIGRGAIVGLRWKGELIEAGAELMLYMRPKAARRLVG